MQAGFLRCGPLEMDADPLHDLGIVGQSLVKFGFRHGVQTSREGRHTGAIDWLGNAILKNHLGLGYLKEATHTKQQRKGHREELTKFAQRTFS